MLDSRILARRNTLKVRPIVSIKRENMNIDQAFIVKLREQLDNHPIYEAVQTLDDLRVFMQHHIYSVWDFMSLVKYLQHVVAPARVPWIPASDSTVQRFINELVLEEETDEAGASHLGVFSSHFQLYIEAMREIGAEVTPALQFVAIAGRDGMAAAFAAGIAPAPALAFTRTTFGFIDSGKPYAVAAALALGREHVIPAMFRALLARMAVDEQTAPTFHYYLKRHIHLDENMHAPLSLRLLTGLCANQPQYLREARQVAEQAVAARVAFWDAVLKVLPSQQPQKEQSCRN